jgi:hypothetical protein
VQEVERSSHPRFRREMGPLNSVADDARGLARATLVAWMERKRNPGIPSPRRYSPPIALRSIRPPKNILRNLQIPIDGIPNLLYIFRVLSDKGRFLEAIL